MRLERGREARKGDLALVEGASKGSAKYNGMIAEVESDSYQDWCYACKRLEAVNDIKLSAGRFKAMTANLIPISPDPDFRKELEAEVKSEQERLLIEKVIREGKL